MLNYFVMKWLCSFVFLLVTPLTGLAQGVRMSADFLPLAVGNRWVYDVTTEDGRKISEMDFSVREHTIVGGRSFYVLTRFPFVVEGGSQLHLIRYDRAERQFVRMFEDEESPLFFADGTTTEVVEADKSGLPMKFVLHSSQMAITFQRGVGIIEVRLTGGNSVQIAKISSARVGEGVAAASPAPDANRTPRPPTAAQSAGIPAPSAPERARRVDNVASISDDNPVLFVEAGEVSEGHRLVLNVRNISDKLLPFTFSTGQTYDFAIIDPATGQEVWRWSRHMFFVSRVKRTEAIAPERSWKFEVVWNHRDNDLKPVPPGTDTVVGFVTTQPALESDSLTIEVK